MMVIFHCCSTAHAWFSGLGTYGSPSTRQTMARFAQFHHLGGHRLNDLVGQELGPAPV